MTPSKTRRCKEFLLSKSLNSFAPRHETKRKSPTREHASANLHHMHAVVKQAITRSSSPVPKTVLPLTPTQKNQQIPYFMCIKDKSCLSKKLSADHYENSSRKDIMSNITHPFLQLPLSSLFPAQKRSTKNSHHCSVTPEQE